MKIEQIGRRGTLFIFDEIPDFITRTYLCFTKNHTYVVDTYCGPDSMEPVIRYIRSRAGNKPIRVVNTHFHWDHVWGNCAFPEESILAHEECFKQMDLHWEKQLLENQVYQTGTPIKKLPTLLIQNAWDDPEDLVRIYHTPGHTDDSISFLDQVDDLLFVGDNVEFPIPYVESGSLETFMATLDHYLATSHRHYVSSHAVHTDKELILHNLNYLRDLAEGEEIHFIDPYTQRVHQLNLDFLRGS